MSSIKTFTPPMFLITDHYLEDKLLKVIISIGNLSSIHC